MPPHFKEMLKAIAIAVTGVIVRYLANTKDSRHPPHQQP